MPVKNVYVQGDTAPSPVVSLIAAVLSILVISGTAIFLFLGLVVHR
jgi:hypothetical protein